MTARNVVVHRTEAKSVATPIDSLDVSVPILCDSVSFELDSVIETGAWWQGVGPVWELELLSAKSILIVTMFTFRWYQVSSGLQAVTLQAWTEPGDPPPDQSGTQFLGPYAEGRTVVLPGESGPYSDSVVWSSVIAREAGTIELFPHASLRWFQDGVEDSTILGVTVEVETNVVIGSYMADECVEWGTPG